MHCHCAITAATSATSRTWYNGPKPRKVCVVLCRKKIKTASTGFANNGVRSRRLFPARSRRSQPLTLFHKPRPRIELGTFALQVRCTATVLSRPSLCCPLVAVAFPDRPSDHEPELTDDTATGRSEDHGTLLFRDSNPGCWNQNPKC